jgi:hypothetical protein
MSTVCLPFSKSYLLQQNLVDEKKPIVNDRRYLSDLNLKIFRRFWVISKFKVRMAIWSNIILTMRNHLLFLLIMSDWEPGPLFHLKRWAMSKSHSLPWAIPLAVFIKSWTAVEGIFFWIGPTRKSGPGPVRSELKWGVRLTRSVLPQKVGIP